MRISPPCRSWWSILANWSWTAHETPNWCSLHQWPMTSPGSPRRWRASVRLSSMLGSCSVWNYRVSGIPAPGWRGFLLPREVADVVDLRQADPFLQFFADNPKMQNCMESIFGLVMNGGTPPAGPSWNSRLRMGECGEIVQNLGWYIKGFRRSSCQCWGDLRIFHGISMHFRIFQMVSPGRPWHLTGRKPAEDVPLGTYGKSGSKPLVPNVSKCANSI